MFSLDVEGVPTDIINDAKRCSYPIRTLRQARRIREFGFERGAMRKTKRLKKAFGPTTEAMKTKMLAEINDSKSDSDDSDSELSKGNNKTSHAKAPNDLNYFEGDE
jgi:hypothetical protein